MKGAEALKFYAEASPEALAHDGGRIARFALTGRTKGAAYGLDFDAKLGEEIVLEIGEQYRQVTVYVVGRQSGCYIGEEVDVVFRQRNLSCGQ